MTRPGFSTVHSAPSLCCSAGHYDLCGCDRDRLSFMRFLGLGLADMVPDANTIWTFREALMRARIAGKLAIGPV